MTAGARRWLFMAVSHMSFSEKPLNLRRKRMSSEGKEENDLPPREHSSRNLPVPGEIQRDEDWIQTKRLSMEERRGRAIQPTKSDTNQ
jgi:hypothetical protein